MSVSSILAFVLAGAAAKAKSVQVARPSEDIVGRAVMKEMARELREAKARIADLEDDIARANVQYRRDQELIDLWRERALVNVPALPQPAGPDFRPPHIAQMQAQAALQQMQARHENQVSQNLLAQYNAQQQGLAQMQMAAQNAMVYGQGLMHGAQAINDLWCNCVPSRAQVWAADRTE
jgi:hypothetical protein